MRKLLFGIALILAACLAPLILVMPVFKSLMEEPDLLKAPGEWEVMAEEPGRYYVWNEYQTVYDGTTYAEGEALPSGITFSLVDAATEEAVPFETDASISASSGATKKNSVGYFSLEEPGLYRLRIEGVEEPRIFSFGPSVFGDFFSFFGRIVLAGLAAFAAAIGGLLLIIFGIVELVRKEKNAAR